MSGGTVLKPILITILMAAFSVGSVKASILPQIGEAKETETSKERPIPPLYKRYVEVAPGLYQAVKGKRERRQIRSARWTQNLTGDRAKVFTKAGMPTFRYQERLLDRVTEIWIYMELNKKLTFEGNRLIESTFD